VERNYRGTDVIPAEQVAPRIEAGDDRATKAPGYFGLQLMAVRKIALRAVGQADEIVTAADYALVKPMQAATGLNTDVPSEGGFLVEPQRASGILQRAYTQGQVLSRVNRMPIGATSNGMVFNVVDETSRANGSRFGGLVSTWVGQAVGVTAGKPTFAQIELKLRKIMATLYATGEMLSDAVALEGWVNTNLPRELTFRAEDAIFNGTGGNQPIGVLNAAALLTVTRSTSGAIKYDDVQAMWRRMYSGSWGNAAWFVDQSVLTELENMHVAIGTGGQLAPAYKAPGSDPKSSFGTLYGKPVIPTEYGANLGTTGDIILADLSEYLVIDKGGVDQAVSIHVAFLTDEQVFRFIYRIDGQLAWKSALTPKSGGATQSPVLVLS
jgi:HK97 family phage major capsid protein